MPLWSLAQSKLKSLIRSHFRIGTGALLALFVMGLMLGVTFVYWHDQGNEMAARRQADFVQTADQMALSIHRRLSSYELALRGVKGFYENSEVVTRSEYRRYFETLLLDEIRPGMQALGIATLVHPADRDRHVAEMRGRGFANYRIRPSGDRAQYTPLILIEPHTDRNASAIGFDVSTNPAAEPALRRARDTGAMAMTSGIRLVQDADQDHKAVVMYLPIYAAGAPAGTPGERRAAVVGWVSGPFRVSDLMAGLGKQLDSDIGIAIYDGSVLSPANKLYSDSVSLPPINGDNPLHLTRTLDLGGKRWTLVMHTLPAFDIRLGGQSKQLMVAAGGSVLSLLLGFLAWLLVTGRERAVALANAMTKELRTTQADHEATLNAMPDALFELGLDGRCYSYRTSRMNLLAAPPEVFLGRRISDIWSAPTAQTCMEALQEAHTTGISVGKQIEIPVGDALHWFELSVARKDGGEHDQTRFIMVSRDITERKQYENQLRLDAQVFDSSRDGIVVTDAQNRILSVNRAFTAITGYEESDVAGRDPRVLSSGRQDGAFYAAMWQVIQHEGHWQGELWNRRKNGEIYPQWLSVSAVKDMTGTITKHIGILSDLTESNASKEHIDYLAHYDPLTQLPNHQLLHDRTRLALATAKRTVTRVALLCLDLDRFQSINDSLGRPVGDQVLRALATRLSAHLQADDTVCRQGGDEFFLLLPNTDADDAAKVANRMLTTIKQPVLLDDGQELRLTASIGIAVYPEDGHDFDQLSQSADAALNQAKQDGRNGFKFFAEGMRVRAHQALLIENQLRMALPKGELLLHYQPQVDAESGRIVGVEALIRWQHPEWGMVSPGRFIPVAENSGQILEIGDWVIRTAVQQMAEWRLQGLRLVPVAVNLSALQFHQSDLHDTVKAVLKEHDLSPEWLELELTESIAMEDSGFALDQISKLHALGLALSIDDFGTGYSSLSYLKRYKIDKLKIDQSFVQGLDTDGEDGAIVQAIIHMARGLGFKTIAEGVETQKQLDLLRAYGCNEIQGYFFSRPVPADAFSALLRRGVALSGHA